MLNIIYNTNEFYTTCGEFYSLLIDCDCVLQKGTFSLFFVSWSYGLTKVHNLKSYKFLFVRPAYCKLLYYDFLPSEINKFIVMKPFNRTFMWDHIYAFCL